MVPKVAQKNHTKHTMAPSKTKSGGAAAPTKPANNARAKREAREAKKAGRCKALAIDFVSLLLVPVGLAWFALNLSMRIGELFSGPFGRGRIMMNSMNAQFEQGNSVQSENITTELGIPFLQDAVLSFATPDGRARLLDFFTVLFAEYWDVFVLASAFVMAFKVQAKVIGMYGSMHGCDENCGVRKNSTCLGRFARKILKFCIGSGSGIMFYGLYSDRQVLARLPALNSEFTFAKQTSVLVTGANSGVGLYASALMYERGANVIMACRTTKKCDAAARR